MDSSESAAPTPASAESNEDGEESRSHDSGATDTARDQSAEPAAATPSTSAILYVSTVVALHQVYEQSASLVEQWAFFTTRRQELHNNLAAEKDFATIMVSYGQMKDSLAGLIEGGYELQRTLPSLEQEMSLITG